VIKSIGRATYKRGKLYFDESGWAILKQVAKRTHRSPKALVIAAIMRYIKRSEREKAKDSRD
jgi:predicted transcriptional regulator